MDSIDQLTEYFRKFPGIGPRQAKRFVYYLLTQSDATIDGLISRIRDLKGHISICISCFRYFTEVKAVPDSICNICSKTDRDRSLLMIVSRDVDLQALEKSRAYKGLYFVLGGSVPILEDHPETRIRQKELLNILNKRPEIKEIILATSINPEGEHTALYLTSLLKAELKEASRDTAVTITTLGRGLSTGTEIEYSDADTIKSAFENRK